MTLINLKDIDDVFDTIKRVNENAPAEWRKQILDQLTVNDGIDELRKLAKVKAVIQNFVNEHHISHEEVIYQTDRVIINAYEFIHELVELIGYKETDDDDN